MISHHSDLARNLTVKHVHSGAVGVEYSSYSHFFCHFRLHVGSVAPVPNTLETIFSSRNMRRRIPPSALLIFSTVLMFTVLHNWMFVAVTRAGLQDGHFISTREASTLINHSRRKVTANRSSLIESSAPKNHISDINSSSAMNSTVFSSIGVG